MKSLLKNKIVERFGESSFIESRAGAFFAVGENIYFLGLNGQCDKVLFVKDKISAEIETIIKEVAGG